MRERQVRKLVALVAVGLLAGACGDGAGTEAATDKRAASISQEQIEGILLEHHEVPSGYAVSPAEGGAADLVLCSGLAELRAEVAEGVSARGRFTGPDQISTIGQEAYFDPAGTNGVTRLREIFAACDRVTTKVQGRPVELAVKERPFRSYGDESAAFRVSGELLGLPFGADFAAVSLGGVVSLVYAGGVGNDHGEVLERLVDLTYAKQERVTRQ
jgi:hypothetical protein